MKRRRCNKILGLEDAHGTWCTDPNQVDAIVVSYFQNLFIICQPQRVEEITGCIDTWVSPANVIRLLQPISEEEVRQTVFQIPTDKAPGPDGFTGSFYHEYWDVVGKDVVDMVKAFWFSGKLLRKLNHTHLVLIPKVSSPRNMSQLRPISLCNVVYKVIAKLLTNRIKMVMPHLISANQSTFVAGRQIQDNVLVVHEILHSLNQQNDGDEFSLAMKLDMAKAYDRVEWRFLLAMMGALGFPPMFC